MRNFISTFFFLALILGCKSDKESKDEIVRNNVEEIFQKILNDPESYELVELELIDSALFIHKINFRKKILNSRMEIAKMTVDQQTRFKEKAPSMYSEDNLLKAQETMKEIEKKVSSIDSIGIVLGDKVNEVASYTYLFKARANNKFGAKILNSYYVETSPNLEVFNIFDKDGEILFSTPNGFSGYDEIMNSNY